MATRDMAPLHCDAVGSTYRALHHRRRKPVVDDMTGWRHAVVMPALVLHGAGMFVVEEKASGKFAGGSDRGRRRLPGFEVGWGIAKEFRGKGFAVEAARASIDWRSQPSTSNGSFTASIAKIPRRKP